MASDFFFAAVDDYGACVGTAGSRVVDSSALVAGVAAGCVEAGCALVGGETAELPDLYRGDDFDLAGFIVGVVARAEGGGPGGAAGGRGGR